MRVVVRMALILVVAGCSANGGAQSSGETPEHIIDVRTAGEFESGHIEGALLIPYDVIAARIAEVTPDKEARIALYCRSGRRSGIALKTLTEMGYTKVTNEGGFAEYSRRLEGKRRGD